ncbi:MAG: ABC transporter substrate-binding protein [Patescibacteria group bacterium]|nr:ABC transporter substrate-binding protein [Patescibacteria group bacterium]
MKKMTKIVIVAAIVLAVAGIWYGVARNKSNILFETEKPIKIGVLADLSGDYTSFLRGIPRGAELAIEDIKKETSRKIELIFEDQKSCDVKETITAINKLVWVDKVDMVIGGSCSNTTVAAAPVANQSKTIMISPSSSASSVSQAGDYVFRTCPSDALKAKAIGQLAYDLGKRKMAVFVELSNTADIEAANDVKEAFKGLGGEIVIEEKINSSKETDFRTQLAKIKTVSPDVLLISITSPAQIALVLKQLGELGIKIQVVHPMEAPENQEVIDIAGKAAEGLIYAMQGAPPNSKEFLDLEKRYREKYGQKEIPQYLAESYDAAVLGIKAVLASNGTKEDIKNKLYEISRVYQGVSGNVAFDENGDVNKPVILKIIQNGQFVPYEESE